LLAVLDGWCRVAMESSADTLAAAVLPWLFSADHLADERTRGRWLRGLAQMLARVAPPSLARHAAGLRAWSSTRVAALKQARVRTLVVAGTDDLLTPDTREVAEAIANADYLAIGGAGHAVALEQPDAVNEALVRHLTAA
jgi:pimeloyl-ACP methyl ester carboxylesterase